MICLNCDSKEYEVVMSEHFPCSCCDEGGTFLEYCLCHTCGSMWRAINGEIDTKNVVSPDEVMNMINPMGNIVAINPEEVPEMNDEFFKRLEDEIARHDKPEGDTTMADMVHKCLKCDALAHEVAPGAYECSKCEFSWEIIDTR